MTQREADIYEELLYWKEQMKVSVDPRSLASIRRRIDKLLEELGENRT